MGRRRICFRHWQSIVVIFGVVLFLPEGWGETKEASRSGYTARVIRDAYGVPHIFGERPADVAYALGQAQCEDRLHDLVYNLHAGMGRLTEIYGERMLEADKAQRLLRHGEMARRDWPKLPPELREVVEAFVAGVNDWVEAHPNALPFEVRAFTAVDVIAWHRQLMMLSSVGIAKADGNAAIGEAPAGVAPGKSNSWAVAGEKSATGKPVLLIDPHWPIQGNLQLYEAHLVGGDLNAWGFMLVGTPVVGLGATQGVAWTFTAGGADSSDAFALRIREANPDEYEFDGQYVPMEVRTEVYRIREGNEFKEVRDTARYTRHGPVMKNKDGEFFAAGINGWDHALTLEQCWRMSLARTAKEFKSALALNRLSYFNVMWGTADGDIGFVQTGEVPLRRGEYNWEMRVPGWTSKAMYQGKVPFDRLPQVENPPTHFLQNCNVAANVVTPGLTFTKKDFPPGALYGHYGQYRARGQRATDLLLGVKKLDLETARQVTFDTYCLPADMWVPIILEGFEEAGRPEELREAAEILRRWDRRAEADSMGATVFRFWRYASAEIKGSPIARDDFQVPNTPAVRKDAMKALKTAAEDLRKRYGRIAVPWGDIKRLRRGEKEWPLSGDGLGQQGMDTLRATAANELDKDNKLIPSGGQSTIGLVFLGEKPVIHAVVAYGQSNVAKSRHFADQAPLYASHRLRPVPWTEAEVKEQATSEKMVRSRP